MSHLGARLERASLMCFLFHSAFEAPEQIASGVMHPQERLTPAALEIVLDHLLERDYRFVGMADIAGGLVEGQRHAHITLDDGYANNLMLMDLLRRYQVPVTVFVSTDHVAHGKAFWWDVVYRARHREGRSGSAAEEISWLATKPRGDVDRYLEAQFGPRALQPVGDADRPLAPPELRALSQDPLITLGNHTTDHALLTLCSETEIEERIGGAQRYIADLTGAQPTCISFPHGGYDERVLDVARRDGLDVGLTIEQRKNRVPLDPARTLRLGRFSVACDAQLTDRLTQCRSEIQLERTLRRALRRPADA